MVLSLPWHLRFEELKKIPETFFGHTKSNSTLMGPKFQRDHPVSNTSSGKFSWFSLGLLNFNITQEIQVIPHYSVQLIGTEVISG